MLTSTAAEDILCCARLRSYFMVNAIAVIIGGLYGAYYVWAELDAFTTAAERVRWTAVDLAATFFATILTIGIAEMIKLVMDIEHNTRVAAHSATEARTGKKWLDGEETAEGAPASRAVIRSLDAHACA